MTMRINQSQVKVEVFLPVVSSDRNRNEILRIKYIYTIQEYCKNLSFFWHRRFCTNKGKILSEKVFRNKNVL